MPRSSATERSYSLKSTNALTGITIPNHASLSPTAALTLEVRIKPVPGGSVNIFDNSSVGVTNSYYFFIDTLGRLYFYSTVGGVAKNIIATTMRCRPAEWNIIHAVYDGANIILYINSVVAGTLPATGAMGVNAGPLRIMQYYNGSVAQMGLCANPRIWNRALSPTEIAQRTFFNVDDADMRSGLVLDMRFTEGSGTAVADSSGLGNNGTFSAPVWSTDVPFRRRRLAKQFAGSIISYASNNAAVSGSDVGFTGSYTYGGWFQWAGENGAGQVMMGIEASPTNPNIAASRNVVNVSVPWSSGGVIAVPGNFIPGEWLHIISSLNSDTNTSKLYFMSRLVDQRVGTPLNPVVYGKVHVLRHPGTGLPFNGRASDVYGWDRDLTDDEIESLCQSRIVPQSGLRFYYDMSNQSGTTVTDLSGNNNHATIVSPQWGTSAPSKARTASSRRVLVRELPASLLMSSSSVISKTSPVGLPTGTSSRSIIINMFFATDDVSSVLDMHVNGAQSFGPILGRLGGGYVLFSDRINVGNNLSMTRDEFYRYIGVGRWRRIAYTYDGGTTLKLYVDGVLVKTATLGVALNTGTINTLLIASGQTAAQGPIYPFNGYAQDAVICNTELTPTEVADDYFIDKLPASAVFRMKASEGTGLTAADSVGTNSCTLTSTAWSTNTMFKKRVGVT